MHPKLVDQYRCQLNIQNTRISLTGPSRADIEIMARNLITGKGGTIRTEEVQGTTLFFLSSYKQGNEPVGWISSERVPASLSIEHWQKNVEAVAA